MHLTFEWMEPKKKRRQLFRSEEYRDALTIEEAFWMKCQETAWFAPILDWELRNNVGPAKRTTDTSGTT